MDGAQCRIQHIAAQLTASPADDGVLEVLIVGAGFSGLLSAVTLADAGVPLQDVLLLEAGPGCGGVWREAGVGNFPGAACDVQAYTYLPMLQRVGFVPSKKYVGQAEISEYAALLATRLGVMPRIRFRQRVTSLRRIGDVWEVSAEGASVRRSRHVVLATGPLSTPRWPVVEGLGTFKGHTMHTARFDHSVSLKGKRVGVVGTGASAAQVITTIAKDVKHLTVFQRTPVWAMPREDAPTSNELREKITSEAGFTDRLRHGEQADTDVEFFPQIHEEKGNKVLQSQVKAIIKKQVPDDEDLRAKLTPSYPIYCKRVLYIDDYYSTFTRPNVSLVVDAKGVRRETERGITTASGAEFELDAIIYATGFDIMTVPFPVQGRNGRTLEQKWGGKALAKPRTLFGIHVSEFPNLHIMIGPHSLNPLTNVTLLAEEQARHIAGLVSHMRRRGFRSVEPKPEAEDEWVRRSEATSDGKVWLQCANWYMKTTDGREPYRGMWMGTYAQYMREALERDGVHGAFIFSC